MAIPMYTASVRLQIDRSAVKVVEGGNVSPTDGNDGDFLRTQFELIQGRAMAERVASRTRVSDDADFFKPQSISVISFVRQKILGERAAGSTDRAARERAAVSIIMRGRGIRPVAGSRLVDVTYSDPNPARAQSIAAAFGEEFIASTLDKRFQANAFAKTFLEDFESISSKTKTRLVL